MFSFFAHRALIISLLDLGFAVFLFDIMKDFVYTFILRRDVLMSINFKIPKVIVLLLFVIMLASLLCVGSMSAFAEEKSYGAFNYTETDEGICITKYTGEMTEVFIPNTIDDKVVVGIGDEAFWYEDSITNIKLPEYLETIGARAFQGCSSLEEIVLPDTVCEISDAAFDGCKQLKSVNIPANLNYVGSFAFDSTKWIERFEDNTSIIFGGRVFYKYLGNASQVVIPRGVLSISANAFAYNENLSYVDIPDTVAIIGNYAFYECPKLKEVSLPASVYLLGEYTFGCYEDGENKKIATYDDFAIYSETENEEGEELVASLYCKERGIKLYSPSNFATPDELPKAEVCVAKELSEDGDTANTLNTSEFVLIAVVSCVVVIGGIFAISTIYEKKRKKNGNKTQKATAKKKK